ncbi:MAG: hypothetical protein ACTMH0_08250 [Brevibacterium linens]
MADMLYTEFTITPIQGEMNWIADQDLRAYHDYLRDNLREATVEFKQDDNGRDITSIIVTLPYPKAYISAQMRGTITSIVASASVEFRADEKRIDPAEYEESYRYSLSGVRLYNADDGSAFTFTSA